ncbi:s-phase kinase-associated, putative, partial [Ichthyophthirius multifiliis]
NYNKLINFFLKKMDLEQANNTKDINLVVQGDQKVSVDFRFKNVSGLIYDMHENNPDEDIPIQEITKEMLNTIISYCKRHNWTPPQIKRPLKSNNLQTNLCEQDYLFIKDYKIYNDTKLRDLIQAAYYLQIQSLYDVCICRLASEFYFGNDQQSFEDLKKNLNVTEDITIEQDEKIQKDHPWIRDN